VDEVFVEEIRSRTTRQFKRTDSRVLELFTAYESMA
jgi:hypothetical protein